MSHVIDKLSGNSNYTSYNDTVSLAVIFAFILSFSMHIKYLICKRYIFVPSIQILFIT